MARGYSRKDLNVSFLRGQKIILQNKVDSVKEQTKDFIERKKDEYLHKWEETSKEVIGAFLKYFGSPIDEFWNRGKRRITQVCYVALWLNFFNINGTSFNISLPKQ